MNAAVTLPAHSSLGASGAHRWMHCPASPRLCEPLPSRTSEPAAEGTVAHDIAAQCLTNTSEPHMHIGQHAKQDGYEFVIDQEMAEAVDSYGDEIAKALQLDSDATVWVERKFHLKELNPKLFGTADAVVWLPKFSLLKVYDFKYGKGVAVEAVGNPQMRYYALGALLESRFPAKYVEGVIVQPRCPHPDGPVRSEQLHISDLIDWTDDLLIAADATEAPDAPAVPGSWCRWCDAAPVCPALHEEAQEAAQTVFEPDRPYDEAVLATALDLVPILEHWCKSVRQFAFAEAEHGRATRGWKLVNKRATRKWRDEEFAAAALHELGLDDDDIYADRKMRSPTQIEKVAERESIRDLIVSESSGLTLAPESDKRKGVIRDPQSVFKEES